MATQITATLPTLDFPREVDYPTQEDWAAFSAAAELNFGILGGDWSTQMQLWKTQANAMSTELNNNATDAQNARDEAVSAIAILSSGAIDDTIIATNKAFSNQYIESNYYAKTEINSKLSQLFIKPKSRSRLPLFIKQTPYSIYIPSGTKIEVSDSILEINSNITISLNSNLLTPEVKTAGTDYYVYAKSDSTFYISGNNEIITDRLLGGFHYGLTAEAESTSGTKTEADMVKIRGINEYSLWDLKYYAKCYAGNKGIFSDGISCYDIYLGGVDYGINLYSKANVQIAGGGLDAPYNRGYPKIPLIYGGNGTINYGKLTPFIAYDLVNAAGKELIGYTEFTKVAYGVQEGLSQAEPISGQTGHIGALTSKYGMELATGSQYIWSRDFGTSAATAWSAIADNRGQVYTGVQVAILGGVRNETAGISGSRCSNWDIGLSYSAWLSGFRARCDLMILD